MDATMEKIDDEKMQREKTLENARPSPSLSSRSTIASIEAIETLPVGAPPGQSRHEARHEAAFRTAAEDVQAEGQPEHEEDPIPDGGLEAWLQVLGSFVILVDTWGLVNSWGVFQTYYETTLLPSSSSSAISWIGSLQGALMMLVGVVSGPLYDAGYFRHLIATGLSLIVLGMFMTSLCREYWQFLLAQGITVGIGMGLTFLPSAAILAQYFRRRRALVLGISSTGSPIAGLVIPVIFSRLEPRVGFGWATRVIAFVLLAISAVPMLCMHTRRPAATLAARTASSSSDCGAGAGESAIAGEQTAGKRDAGPRRGRSSRLFDATALRDGPFVTFALGAFFAFLVLYVPFFYVQLFAETHGIAGPDVSPYVVTMLNAGSIVGRVLPNYLADALGSLNVVLACGATSAVLMVAWLGVRDFPGLVAFVLLYGGFSGGIVSVTPSVLISLAPDPSRVGARMGMTFSLTGIAILVGSPVAGAILAGYGDARWHAAIAYAAAGLVVGTMLYSTSRLLLYRANRQWRI